MKSTVSYHKKKSTELKTKRPQLKKTYERNLIPITNLKPVQQRRV